MNQIKLRIISKCARPKIHRAFILTPQKKDTQTSTHTLTEDRLTAPPSHAQTKLHLPSPTHTHTHTSDPHSLLLCHLWVYYLTKKEISKDMTQKQRKTQTLHHILKLPDNFTSLRSRFICYFTPCSLSYLGVVPKFKNMWHNCDAPTTNIWFAAVGSYGHSSSRLKLSLRNNTLEK